MPNASSCLLLVFCFAGYPYQTKSKHDKNLRRFILEYMWTFGRRINARRCSRGPLPIRAHLGGRRTPCLAATSGTVSRGCFPQKSHILQINISISFYPVWTPFDMDILRNKKHATNRNWHWALDQYVSPKNSIKSCQKYVKVVEYWHGTIKIIDTTETYQHPQA